MDYYPPNADPETPRWELARVAKAEHHSEAGLANYAVRHWRGWQQHQTLSLLATWFLVRATEDRAGST